MLKAGKHLVNIIVQFALWTAVQLCSLGSWECAGKQGLARGIDDVKSVILHLFGVPGCKSIFHFNVGMILNFRHI